MARTGSSSSAESLERSARFWLRAYPRRWRTAFGDDFVGILAETSDPDVSRVGTKEAAAIVRAGWALRLREHPPLLRWLAYRFFEVRLPARYEQWVADDIVGRLWFSRYITTCSILAWAGNVAVFSLFSTLDPELLAFAARMFGGMIVLSVPLGGALSTARRRRAWQRHISPEVPWSLLSLRDREQMQRDAGGA